MLVSKIMQTRVSVVSPNTSVRAAAALMLDRDIGMLPVCKDHIPVGIVTDRDLVMRLLSDAEPGLEQPVSAVMTSHVLSCRADQDVVAVARVMGDAQVRRLVVCDCIGRLVGVVSLGDIARDASEELAGQALGEIVECR
ncbi:CBS domain-containing protein [Litoreibacter halocynthiae]|uniref:CBS domain-containing protein n=1 Tax=Litoreibacter halocynthiae TaxID=1242689 RepID=UPI0024938A9E|nr:CBS domain-containing protein [Litoreibacter halocynthiae]